MNFTIGQLPEVVGGEVETFRALTKEINRVISQYPVGSGQYAGLMALEENVASILREYAPTGGIGDIEGGVELIGAYNRLKKLYASELNISRQRRVSHGITTQEEEDSKAKQYDLDRESRISSLIFSETKSPPQKSFLKTALTLGVLGLGGYFLFKN